MGTMGTPFRVPVVSPRGTRFILDLKHCCQRDRTTLGWVVGEEQGGTGGVQPCCGREIRLISRVRCLGSIHQSNVALVVVWSDPQPIQAGGDRDQRGKYGHTGVSDWNNRGHTLHTRLLGADD